MASFTAFLLLSRYAAGYSSSGSRCVLGNPFCVKNRRFGGGYSDFSMYEASIPTLFYKGFAVVVLAGIAMSKGVVYIYSPQNTHYILCI